MRREPPRGCIRKPSGNPTLALAEPAVGIASALADTRAAAPRQNSNQIYTGDY
ncbi:hypothetical protein [Chamaesiphon minutus]|uniref:hypothetical protein n=1 Tax=Chamaesiphon minutus TaxID=1173032 RepID=UPI0012F9997E|nr:hypothetical protein [Chamaesiphon minutus]